MGERVEFIVMKKRWEINKGREKTKLVGLTLLLRIVIPKKKQWVPLVREQPTKQQMKQN